MKNILLQVFFVCMYLFAGNTFLHAWVMAHDLSGEMVQKNNVQPCHEAVHNHELPKSWDCFEQCMGLYDDFWWLTWSIFYDTDDRLPPNFACYLDVLDYEIKIHDYTALDPPPLTLVWHGCIGKDVKKIE